MNRKDFLKKAALTSLVGTVAVKTGFTKAKSTYDKLAEQVGFNHLPNKESKTMNTVFHQAASRGQANHGWLQSSHSFSFANYYNPDRMNFGVLRVLNDDSVAPGRGFGTHPHDNMEIISIPLSGDLEHKDSMGNTAIIKQGDIQAMSAGTGVSHSEYNKNGDKDVKFLQIWVFPNQRNVTPRYDQLSMEDLRVKNDFYQVLSPNSNDQGVMIHQDAWFSIGEFDQDKSIEYKMNKNGNGVYVFMLDGESKISDQDLAARDGFGIWNVDSFKMSAKKGARVLLMEVPMNLN